ncbi:hypothetical protein ACGFI4_02955 [Micromonospora carbonacea]|uniref:hypothetical protein n=1 Tax=Micromonospora carbonacea TaxID=47853 RepID=UPI003723E21A
MSFHAYHLSRDLEVLSALSEDLAQRIPEGRPMADEIARLDREVIAIVHDLENRDGRRAYRRVCDLDQALTRELDRTLALAEGTAWRTGDNSARVSFLVRCFRLATISAEDLRLALTGGYGTVLRAGIHVHLDRDLAEDLGRSEARLAEDIPPIDAELQPRRQALRMVDFIVRILPPDQRARYDEELRAELYGLAEEKRTYGAQLLYVLRQFNRMFELRYELRRPSPRRLAQPPD